MMYREHEMEYEQSHEIDLLAIFSTASLCLHFFYLLFLGLHLRLSQEFWKLTSFWKLGIYRS